MIEKKHYLLIGKNKTRRIRVGDHTEIVEAYFRPDIREIIQIGQDGREMEADLDSKRGSS